ncbi:MAG: hypothetical protein IJX98_00620 [Clostridia bacterium]|nr:hypothetical protein [Clostridia bacterium]
MTKKIKNIILSALVCLFTGALLTACNSAQTKQDIMDEYDLTTTVTYYANGGDLGMGSTQKTLYYAGSQLALNIGEQTTSSGTVQISRGNYEFLGWYLIATNEDGSLKTQVNPESNQTEYVLTDEKMDFSSPVGEHRTYCIGAKWQRIEVVKVYMLCGESETIQAEVWETNDDGEAQAVLKSYQNGSHILDYSYDKGKDVMTEITAGPLENSMYLTFVAYYADAAGTTPVSWPIEKRGDGTSVEIYAKYLPEVWSILKTKEDVKNNLFLSTFAGKAYLLNDIDCSGLTVSRISKFSGTLEGNRHTISNLNVSYSLTVQNDKLSSKVAAFGAFTEKAVMRDIKIENMTVQFTVASSSIQLPEAYYFASEIASAESFENVTIEGGGLTMLQQSDGAFNNAQATEKYLFGGTHETDEAFLASCAGKITVTDGKQPTFTVQ